MTVYPGVDVMLKVGSGLEEVRMKGRVTCEVEGETPHIWIS